jgi:hypothetical protein
MCTFARFCSKIALSKVLIYLVLIATSCFQNLFSFPGGMMSSEIMFFTGAGFLALVTIFLGISNWIFLASLSTKISQLEDEIEKKTSELETLKKERQSGSSLQFKGNQQSTDRIDQEGYSDSGSQQIEIVRNIRGEGFENYDKDAGHDHEYPQTPPAAEAAAAEQQSDVLDVVDENAAASRSDTITLPLFSNAKKDTDFATAWKHLVEILQSRPTSRIAIDFSNVMFLYDRELLYLEKFRDTILQSGGTVIFVNCETELKENVRKNPGLARYVSG